MKATIFLLMMAVPMLLFTACGYTSYLAQETEIHEAYDTYTIDITATPTEPALSPTPLQIHDYDEPYISDVHFEAIVDFFTTSYPEIFMRTTVGEDTYGGQAGFRHGSWFIFDFYRGAPVVAIRFHDAGSWTGPAHYMFVDGKYRSVPDLPLDISWTVPTRPLGHWQMQITDAVNRRLWPMLALRDDGIMVDGNLSNAAIDAVISFILKLEHVYAVDVVKCSLFEDNLVSVYAICPEGFSRYHWVILHETDGHYEVYYHREDFLWWQ